MSTFSNTAREVEMPNGDIVKLHDAVTPNSTSNIKKFKYDDNGHVTESEAANATDLNLNSYATPTSGTTAIGTSDNVQTAIGKLDHQSHIDQTNILSVKDMVCDDAFSTSKSYAVGDITIYDNKLYKFKNAHQGAWSASDVDQISLSEQNSDLTHLEAEDRAALAEVVDSGAKNVYQVPVTIDNDAGLTITTNPSTGTITVSGTATKDRYIQISGNLSLYGTYIVQGCPSTGSSSTYYLHLEQSSEVGANDVGDKNYAGSTNTYNSASCKLYIRIFNGVAFGSGVTFTPIVCTKAAFCVSSKFVPYRPNWDLVCDKVTSLGLTKTISPFTPSAADTYECVTASKISVPANKILRITVACIYQSSYATGIKLVRGTTMENSKTLAVSESDTDYNTLPISTVCSFGSDQDIYVFIKCNSTGATKILLVYDII